MKILLSPVGIYVGRVLKGISKTKPDKIYLFVSKREEDSDYTKEWSVATEMYAKDIMKRISLFYGRSDIKVVSEKLGNYSRMLKIMINLVIKHKDAEFLIDITSARRGFEMAAITLGMFFTNVRCFYIPPKEPLMPSDYSRKVIKDEGGEPETITTPKVDFSELQKRPLKDILVVLSLDLKGRSDKFIALLRALKWDETRSNVIRLSKMIKKLENYGCVRTKRFGREKSVELTLLGESLAVALGS